MDAFSGLMYVFGDYVSSLCHEWPFLCTPLLRSTGAFRMQGAIAVAGMATLTRMQHNIRTPLVIAEHVLVDGPDIAAAARAFGNMFVRGCLELLHESSVLPLALCAGADYAGFADSGEPRRMAIEDVRQDISTAIGMCADAAVRGQACCLEGLAWRSEGYARFERLALFYFREPDGKRCEFGCLNQQWEAQHQHKGTR